MNENTRLPSYDHGRLALGYAIAVGLALVAGALLALGLGMQPLAGGGGGVEPENYRRMYSMHGLLMVFVVALPALPAVIGNWLLPRVLGVREMALPRLNLLGFQLFAAGCAIFVLCCFLAPADAGWSFELPFALKSQARLSFSLVAIVVLAASFVCSGANLFVTVLASRGQGRAWSELPVLAWSLAISSLVQVLATPLLCVALALFFAQRAGAADFFGAAPAGDLRFAEWFWLWGHPAFGAALIAVLGVLAEVIGAHTGGRRAATRTEAVCLIAIAVLAFAASGVHVLGALGSAADAAGTSALSLAVGLPFGLILLGWTRELLGADVRATPSLAYAMCCLVLLCVGGMAGVFLSVLPTAAQLRETCFATAQFHYLVAGGTLAAFFAGLYHAWPRWFGVEVRAGWGHFGCALFFVGMNLCFFPLFVLGYLGQPRRSTQLIEGGASLGTLSACGTVLVLVALVITAWNLLSSLMQERSRVEEPA